MERKIEVRHVSLETNAGFDSFTQKFEESLGRFDPSAIKDVLTNPAAAEQRLKLAEGEEGLMLFDIRDHGTLLNIFGAPRKAKQYVLGNPLVAITMTRHDIRAGLYAPLRVLVYEDAGHTTRIEYDQPSSLFGQFDNPEVSAIAQSLDTKLANLIRKAESGAAKTQAHGS
jgi:uncharacterized protein (DUF302 family)